LRFAGRYLYQIDTLREEGIMVEKQTEADKAQAMREYREKHEAAMRRIATLRAARLARDAAVSAAEKPKSKRRS
jgi:hypothetical protein